MTLVRRNSRSARGRPWRMARLFFRRNALRRPSERFESAVVAALLAAFAAGVVVAAFLAVRVYHSEQASSASLRPTVAVVSTRGALIEPRTPQETAVWATWRLGDGAVRSGLLTTSVVPGIFRQSPGSPVRVWLSPSGALEPPPQGSEGMIAGAAMAALAFVVAVGAVLGCGYLLCLRALERHRLARWSSAWAVIGPQWTSRQ
jgi:hypothetical protein